MTNFGSCIYTGHVCTGDLQLWVGCSDMMTSSNANIFRVTGPLCGEFTGHRWIPRTKASDAELWCFLWSAPWVNNREAGDLSGHQAHYDVIVMCWWLSYVSEYVPWWPISGLVKIRDTFPATGDLWLWAGCSDTDGRAGHDGIVLVAVDEMLNMSGSFLCNAELYPCTLWLHVYKPLISGSCLRQPNPW